MTDKLHVDSPPPPPPPPQALQQQASTLEGQLAAAIKRATEKEAHNQRLTQEKDTLARERDTLAREKDGLVTERDALGTEKDGLVKERDMLAGASEAAVRDLNHVLQVLSDGVADGKLRVSQLHVWDPRRMYSTCMGATRIM